MSDNIKFNDENINHLEPSPLKISGTHGKPVKLYRYVGSTTSTDWEMIKDYFFYVSPEFVLRNGVTGFTDYGMIGWYCKHKDLFIVEQRLGVPLHLTIGYREKINRTEAGEWYKNMTEQNNEREEKIREIKSWFTEAVYPESVRDYLDDIINTSRVYLPSRDNFFEEGSIAFFIREEQDFISMFVNLEYDKSLGNCNGILDGIFCYLDFDVELADLINDWCIDETDEFRELFIEARNHYVYHHEPVMYPPHHHHHHRPPKKPHKFHTGCTKQKKKCDGHHCHKPLKPFKPHEHLHRHKYHEPFEPFMKWKF